ncbi:MAG: MBL fold metallo-hydrolase [Desulfobacterales bacterium]|nr:MBL fold metallo-hydrolase [Desulfobacterales bacterium]MBF0395562.1 MBL fold metallo-hydrolase [Desulfobacterales bacterium]
MKILFILIFLTICLSNDSIAQEQFEKETIKTKSGDVEITFIGHGSLILKFNEKLIYIDPFSKLADYSKMPKADMIVITHHHQDHLDTAALKNIRTEKTIVIYSKMCEGKVERGKVMNNGDVQTVMGIKIKAVPAYNIVHKRDDGKFYHPKGEGNGYVLTFGDKNIYIGGDTENIPEMNELKNINYAFLPMNLPYTMTPEMVADAAKSFKPDVLYPYHYGETDTTKIVELLKGTKIEVRIRKMK